MSIAIIILAAAAIYLLERYWAPVCLRQLRFRGECDQICAEPDQVLTWSASVENPGRIPIPFVRLRQTFPNEAVLIAQPRWASAHCTKGLRSWSVEERLSLKPRQSRTRSVQFSIGRRGYYTVGSHRLAAGDLLGLQESAAMGDGQPLVIMPHRAQSARALEALGGFMGDVSVRRFILEDPILTVGFRDYTGREPLKAVSWTRTAVTGTMQVKQFDHTAEQNVMVLLNVEGGTPEQLEGCFRLMRSVCETLEHKKMPFGIRTNGNLPGPVGNIFYLADGLGGRHVQTVLYALGRADYTCFHSFRYLAGQTLKHRKNNESYIVITPSNNQEVASCARQLGNAVGSAVCVLTGDMEVGQ